MRGSSHGNRERDSRLGGSRAMAVTSDRHAARLVFRSECEPGDSVRALERLNVGLERPVLGEAEASVEDDLMRAVGPNLDGHGSVDDQLVRGELLPVDGYTARRPALSPTLQQR
jgi:hypothetical protein